jgi:hypothetical protein
MTVPCNTGFTEAAKFLAGEAADVFKYIAVGKGTGQGAANTKLSSECTESGLTRVAADTCHTTKTTIDNDTVQLIHTFTAAASATVTEAGAFNNATKDLGDMMMVGDLSPEAAMVSSDTLKLTLNNQIKAA